MRHEIQISIHALREEGDAGKQDLLKYSYGISIHALREEGDTPYCRRSGASCRFLSTPSARRATLAERIFLAPDSDFYPRPPRGGRRLIFAGNILTDNFYPRPPRGGRPRDSVRIQR